MPKIAFLRPTESVDLDRGRLDSLCRCIGPSATGEIACRAMEELAVRQSSISAALCDKDLPTVARLARSMVGIADQLGLVTLAKTSEHLARTARTKDDNAIAALGARLCRVGDQSLVAIWDLQDLSV